MIDLQSHREGVVVPVKVRAGGRRNAIVGQHGGALKVEVTAPREQGKANAAVAALLAETLGEPKSAVVLISGAASTQKRFLVRGNVLEEIRLRLETDA